MIESSGIRIWLNCRLDQDTGELSTNGQLHEGEYSFRVKVYDIVWKREVTSMVNVFLKAIGDDAIANSGSLRLKGLCKSFLCCESVTVKGLIKETESLGF